MRAILKKQAAIQQMSAVLHKILLTMYAIVTIAGQQFKVEKGQEIFVHQLEAQEGDELSFDQIHLVEDGNSVQVGKPILDGGRVTATVLGHQKGDKVIVFKKKRRKGYRKKNGHRQRFTKIKIDNITFS